jgi:hypothetical protein
MVTAAMTTIASMAAGTIQPIFNLPQRALLKRRFFCFTRAAVQRRAWFLSSPIPPRNQLYTLRGAASRAVRALPFQVKACLPELQIQ